MSRKERKSNAKDNRKRIISKLIKSIPDDYQGSYKEAYVNYIFPKACEMAKDDPTEKHNIKIAIVEHCNDFNIDKNIAILMNKTIDCNPSQQKRIFANLRNRARLERESYDETNNENATNTR